MSSTAHLTYEERSNYPAHVAYCRKCDGLVFASVDDPERRKENAGNVARAVQAGFRIGMLKCIEVRQAKWCPSECERRRKPSPKDDGGGR